MPTIPTPFIGGADIPERDRTDESDLEPPFFSDEQAESPEQPAPREEAAEQEEPLPTPQAVPAQEPVPIEEVTLTPEPEPAFLAPETEEAPPAAPAPTAEGEGDDLPDYLLGADTPPPFASAEGAAAPPLLESPELLARKAEELLEGIFGDRIRDLVASLGAAAAEVAIPRAFAAGYIAAKSGEEK